MLSHSQIAAKNIPNQLKNSQNNDDSYFNYQEGNEDDIIQSNINQNDEDEEELGEGEIEDQCYVLR